MEEKLRDIGVNADQRKKLMAAAKLGLGPLAGKSDKSAESMLSTPALPPPMRAIQAPAPQAMSVAAAQAEERAGRRKEALKEAEKKKKAAEEELDDVQGFLAGGKASARLAQRERPAERQRHVFHERPPAQPEVALSSGTAERLAERAVSSSAVAERSEARSVSASSARHISEDGSTAGSCDGQGLLTEEIVMAILRRARPSTVVSSPLPAMEEFEAGEFDEADGEDARVSFLKEQRKSAKSKHKKRRKEARKQTEHASEEELEDRDSSEEHRKKRRLETKEAKLPPSVVQIVKDPAKRLFWGESVRGRVSGDYKGFSDAALERRFMAQQQSSTSGERLMSEAEVMAMLKQDRTQARPRKR